MHKIDIATDQDLDGINKLRAAINASFTNYELDSEDIKQSRKRITFVTGAGGQIVGYLSLHCSMSFQDDTEAEFEVGVHPEYEAKGRGSALVERAIQYSAEETKLCSLIALVKKGNSESEGMLKDNLGFLVLEKDNLGTVLSKDIRR